MPQIRWITPLHHWNSAATKSARLQSAMIRIRYFVFRFATASSLPCGRSSSFITNHAMSIDKDRPTRDAAIVASKPNHRFETIQVGARRKKIISILPELCQSIMNCSSTSFQKQKARLQSAILVIAVRWTPRTRVRNAVENIRWKSTFSSVMTRLIRQHLLLDQNLSTSTPWQSCTLIVKHGAESTLKLYKSSGRNFA